MNRHNKLNNFICKIRIPSMIPRKTKTLISPDRIKLAFDGRKRLDNAAVRRNALLKSF